jgi:hypothetical protein
LGVMVRVCECQFWENSIDRHLNVDRSNSDKNALDRLSKIFEFHVFLLKICHFSLNVLQNTKTQKLAKTSENNKAKGLTSVNQGVQIYNI